MRQMANVQNTINKDKTIIKYKGLKTAMSKYSDQRLGKDIIQHYAKYRQLSTDYHTHPLKAKTGIQYEFTIPKSYELIDILGSGSYGVVAAALNNSIPQGQNKIVAVKKVLQPFEHKIITKRILRQLHLLKLLKHENIINLKTIMMPMARQDFNNIYIVFEFMDTDLHEILRSDQQLTREHFQLFMYQIMRGLNYMHAAGIVHRDLKPRNLLLNKNSDLKICDFGLSRSLTHKSKSNELTDYVATRWYRAPQLLLGSYDYDAAVDMWSVGCIFAEMLLRKAFMKGKSTKDQLEIIAQTIGLGGLENMSGISQGGKKLLKKLAPNQPSGSLKTTFKKFGQLQVDLLQKLLAIDPKKRITSVQAMKHPYFQELYDQSDISTNQAFKPCDFQFQQHNLNTQQLKDILYEQILTYNFNQFAQEYENKRALDKSLIDHILVNSNKDNRDPKADQSEEDNDQFN